MQTREQNNGNRRHGVKPLTRRPVLRIRCARPRHAFGQDEEQDKQTQFWSGLKCWQRAARFWRTLVVVKRKDMFQPSSLERGSAATRTVVRSISSDTNRSELTHISRINRR